MTRSLTMSSPALTGLPTSRNGGCGRSMERSGRFFGTDDPGSLLPGWRAQVTEPAIVGNALKRWPFPAAPPGFPGVPRGYLIEAVKG